MKSNPKLDHLYGEEFRFYFSGVESKRQFDQAYAAGVRHFLMAIHHAKDKLTEEEMERRFGNGDCKLLIDSSTFTFHNQDQYYDKKKYTVAYWEKFIVEYLDWVRKHQDYISSFVELDITKLVGVAKVQEWRKKFFLPFEEETGIPCLFMWQPEYSIQEWERMCKEYRYVGFSGEAGIKDSQMIKMLRVARKYGTIVHGMAMTKYEKLKSGKYPFYSVDSISWKSAEIYGMTFIWDGKNFHQLDNKKKHMRKKYKSVMIKNGIDWKLIEQDYANENTKMALIAWVQVAEHLKNMFTRTGKAYWLKQGGDRLKVAKKTVAKSTKKREENEEDVAPIFPPPKRNWEDDLDWEEVAESLNINPKCATDESSVLALIDILTALNFSTNKEYGEYLFYLLKRNEGIVDELHEMFLSDYERDEEVNWAEIPPAFYTKLVTEQDDKYDIVEQVFNGNTLAKLMDFKDVLPALLSGSCDLFQDEADTEEVVERPKPPKEREEYAGDEDRNSLALEPRDETGKFAVGNNIHLKRTKSMLAHIPKLACNTCYAADSCPMFKADSVCYYDKELNKFDTRNMEDVMHIQSDLTNTTIQRVMLARMFEQLDGGMPDRTVTELINQAMYALDQQNKLLRANSQSNGGSSGIQITASGAAGNSILEQLFNFAPPKADVTPPEPEKTSSTVSKIFDAEYTVVNEDKPRKKTVKKKKK